MNSKLLEPPNITMVIQSKLTKKGFINANFVIFYSNFFARVFIVIGLLDIVFVLLGLILDINIGDRTTMLFWGFGLLFFFPSLLYITASRNFSRQNRLSENIEYQFEQDYLIIKGESFQTQMTWEKIYKVVLKKNWLLIYTNKQLATPIARTDVWAGEVEDLKRILNSHRVKNNL
jgi:hypothetical protein